MAAIKRRLGTGRCTLGLPNYDGCGKDRPVAESWPSLDQHGQAGAYMHIKRRGFLVVLAISHAGTKLVSYNPSSSHELALTRAGTCGLNSCQYLAGVGKFGIYVSRLSRFGVVGSEMAPEAQATKGKLLNWKDICRYPLLVTDPS